MIRKYVKAGFPILAVRTFEPDVFRKQVISDVSDIRVDCDDGSEEGIAVYDWDCVNGLVCLTHSDNHNKKLGCEDVISVLNFIPKSAPYSVFLLHNFHKFIKNIEVIQRLLNCVTQIKAQHHTIVIVSSVVDIPPELERIITVLDHSLPSKDHLVGVVKEYVNDYKDHINADDIDDARIIRIAECGLGQTDFEFENGLSLSITDESTINPNTIWEQKCQMVKKNGNIDIGIFSDTLDDLIGLENLKVFGRSVMPSPLARGMLLLGIPGCGKSHYAKALGKELGLPTLSLDFGRIFGHLVGESEERIRTVLHIVEVMSPCILFIDEIEKGMAGSQSSGQTDSGVTARVLGSFLTWMNDHKCQSPIIATCNNIDRLPDEFLRAERWDAIFFIDIPTDKERRGILQHYLKVFELDRSLDDVWKKFDMHNWTGAEIRTFCRLSKIMSGDMDKAYPYVIPIYKSRGDNIKNLQKRSKDIAVPASAPDDGEGDGRKLSVRKLSVSKKKVAAFPVSGSDELN